MNHFLRHWNEFQFFSDNFAGNQIYLNNETIHRSPFKKWSFSTLKVKHWSSYSVTVSKVVCDDIYISLSILNSVWFLFLTSLVLSSSFKRPAVSFDFVMVASESPNSYELRIQKADSNIISVFIEWTENQRQLVKWEIVHEKRQTHKNRS